MVSASPKSSRLARDAMAFVLAGGRGSRLMELTDRRAKPAVFFGGKTRIVDFALSNALNSGIRRIGVATQYKAHSLIRHLVRGWSFMRAERNESLDILPASQRVSEDLWYRGTADAVFQNIDIVQSYAPEFIVVLAGDHIYKMDYERMLQQHVETGADVTVGCLEVPRMEATGFGVMHVDAHDVISAFFEKPADPPGIPDRPDMALASMGIYVFRSAFLFELLERDAADPASSNDFGRDIIPRVVVEGKAVAHRFGASCVRSTNEAEAYWRDVGTVDAYWESNIDLTDITPALDLYDTDWPIWTYSELTAPAKFVHDEAERRGTAISSLVSGGCIVSGTELRRSLLFTGVRTNSYSRIEEAVILPYSTIGRHVSLRKVVIDRGVQIPSGHGRRRGPGARCATIPSHRCGRVPDHATDDRSARALIPTADRDANGERPLGRIGSLSAGQDRRPRRCRRRTAGRPRAARRANDHVGARLSRGDARTAATCANDACGWSGAAGRRGWLPRATVQARPARARCAAPLRARRQSVCRRARHRLARQRRALRFARARRVARGSRRGRGLRSRRDPRA